MSADRERRRPRWTPPHQLGAAIQAVLRRGGYEVQIFPAGDDRRLARLLRARGITLVLDVGANAGQYATRLRRLGYRDRMISFEPLDGPFSELERAAKRDPLWEVRPLALGDTDGDDVINVAGNTQSSSILPMLGRHVESAPDSRYIGTQRVSVKRLTSLWTDLDAPRHRRRIWLKLDVQGYEPRVLRGAEAIFDDIDTVQAEMSIVPLYEGNVSWREVDDWFRARDFRLVGLEPAFEDPVTGELLAVDGIFARRGQEER